jgi:hypothetical protein
VSKLEAITDAADLLCVPGFVQRVVAGITAPIAGVGGEETGVPKAFWWSPELSFP